MGAFGSPSKYKAEAVADLKLRVPANCREYVPDERAWYVHSSCANIAVSILRFHFGMVDVVNGPEPEPIRKNDPDFAALHLLPSAPPELVRSAYKTLAKATRPDRGGDTAAMQRVNSAFEALQKRGVA